MTAEMSDLATTLLRRELASLRHRIQDWTVNRWSARSEPLEPLDTGPVPSRGDMAYALVVRLAELSRTAGSGAPAAAVPPRLGDHALADQLAVLADDLLAAPGVAEVALDALDAVVRCRSALDGTAIPADVAALLNR
jgi:hypothetical protein